jgi:large subunit ribosomal protein L22
MKVTANIKYLKISAQKLRLGADLARGKRAVEAQELLVNMPQKSARMVAEGIKSAIANAENNFNLTGSSLVISEIKVDQGPKLKRGMPRAKGAYGRIEHPMAHLKVTVDSGDEPSKSKTEAKSDEKTATKPKVTTKITTKKRGKK